ncbi:MAG: pyridoxamine 5'-phosphate oxidase family protein [Myxococcota bacterium]
MAASSPFHSGERVVQARLGVREQIEPWARKVIRPYLPEEHRRFYAELPFLVVGARDAAGRPWASLLAGGPGFVASPDPLTLDVSWAPDPDDPVASGLLPGAAVGVLGILPESRRRNRANGRIGESSGEGFRLRVDQTFGNCPQYIHERRVVAAAGRSAAPPERSDVVPVSWRAAVAAADTFFIATGVEGPGETTRAPEVGMDVSHRGGPPGFVERESDGDGRDVLVFPDYAGNNYYNTLGNLELDARAGLVFVDFERGDLLQLSGRAEVVWEVPDPSRFPGARRWLRFRVEAAVARAGALPLRFPSKDDALQRVRVAEVVRESRDVRSFVLRSARGGALAPFEPGQHLPVRVRPAGDAGPQTRTYSLSDAPDGERYRISVKREPGGVVSGHLHDTLAVGDELTVGRPAGDFVHDAGAGRPLVLVGAGIGVTPLASLFHQRARTEDGAPVWLFHGVRDGDHQPLGDELRRAADASPRARLHVRYSRPRRRDPVGPGGAGRLDADWVAARLPEPLARLDADYFLCGPPAFVAALREGLETRGAPPSRIRTETFG